jgi:hypothetical protein
MPKAREMPKQPPARWPLAAASWAQTLDHPLKTTSKYPASKLKQKGNTSSRSEGMPESGIGAPHPSAPSATCKYRKNIKPKNNGPVPLDGQVQTITPICGLFSLGNRQHCWLQPTQTQENGPRASRNKTKMHKNHKLLTLGLLTLDERPYGVMVLTVVPVAISKKPVQK